MVNAVLASVASMKRFMRAWRASGILLSEPAAERRTASASSRLESKAETARGASLAPSLAVANERTATCGLARSPSRNAWSSFPNGCVSRRSSAGRTTRGKSASASIAVTLLTSLARSFCWRRQAASARSASARVSERVAASRRGEEPDPRTRQPEVRERADDRGGRDRARDDRRPDRGREHVLEELRPSLLGEIARPLVERLDGDAHELPVPARHELEERPHRGPGADRAQHLDRPGQPGARRRLSEGRDARRRRRRRNP